MFPLLAALLGCDPTAGGADTGEGGDPCAAGPSPTLAIGTGEQGFEPMPDEVELVHGAQGGYHVVVAFEATHLDGASVIGASVTGTIGGDEVAETAPWFEMRCNPDTRTLQWWGTYLIYPLTPAELDEQPTRIAATLTDGGGASVTSSVETVIVDPLVE